MSLNRLGTHGKGWWGKVQKLDPTIPNRKIETCNCGNKFIATKPNQIVCHACIKLGKEPQPSGAIVSICLTGNFASP